MRNYDYTRNMSSYEERLLKNTNTALLKNFNKVADWIEENCPKLNGEFRCSNNPYHWVKLVVEDGKAYLEEGDHGYTFSLALSKTETATMTTGSMQRIPYAYKEQFFKNDRLEEFLKEWFSIKKEIQAESTRQSYVYSDEFRA